MSQVYIAVGGADKGAIVIWRLEYLKFINEMHGYIAGDNYIKDVAEGAL